MTDALFVAVPEKQNESDPTKRQQTGSNPRASVWVNASAGSGKTSVLTNRVVRLLLDGVPPQRILCLTFTRAAAAEMAIRITERLSSWATCSDDELCDDFAKIQGAAPTTAQWSLARRLFALVLNCPGGLRIRTIHAFCQEILQRFPIEAQVPPHFGIIEQADADSLRMQALQDVLRASETQPDSAIALSLRYLVAEQGEYNLMASLSSLLGERARLKASIAKAGSLPKLIASIRAVLNVPPQGTAAEVIDMAIAPDALPEKAMRQLVQWFRECTPKFAPRGQVLAAWLDMNPSERRIQFDAYCSCFFKKDGGIFTQIANKNILEKYPEFERSFQSEAVRLQAVKLQLDTLRLAEITAAVLTFGMAVIKRYEVHKAARAAMDYDDLIARTDALLSRPDIAPWILYKLDNGLDHILVDEAQDTSRAQWNIVRILADEFFTGLSSHDGINRTLFVVGDEKQSIFSFQRADPEAFAAMRHYFAERIKGADKTYREVPMRVSFRSAQAILDAVDTVFAVDAARSGVSVEPLDHEAFAKSRDDKIGQVEVWPLTQRPAREKDIEPEIWDLPLDYEVEHDPQVELAQQIARKIKRLIGGEVLPDSGALITPGDIMILMRERGRFANLMVRALKAHDIPVMGVDRMNLTKQLAVMDLLAVIQFVLLPEDDLNLATVLRGPILNMSEDQLMHLAIGREGSLWRQLNNRATHDETYVPFYTYLAEWLNRADFMTPFALLADILNQPCPGSVRSGRQALWARLGPDALDPIEELLNAALNFSQRHTPSLQHFLHWLLTTDADIKRDQDRGSGQVRLMTVHASKGLEAPIVFLPDTTGKPQVNKIERLQWTDDDLPLYIARKPQGGVALDIWNAARCKQFEEYRRLFYVALTRAARRLYIAGWEARSEDKQGESWYSLALSALQSLHQPERMPEAADLQPLIVFGDPIVRSSPLIPSKMAPQTPMPPLPAWLFTPAPLEDQSMAALMPSQFLPQPSAATPDHAFGRGRIIHRLLQGLPDVPQLRRLAAARAFLANPQHGLAQAAQDSICEEVLALLDDTRYAPLFGPNSRAEVPLVGQIDGRVIAGQVDRLCVMDDAVWVIDYKTNRPPPTDVAKVPLAYRLQLASYRAVLRVLYPGKTIRCFLLWTYKPALMEISGTLLPEALTSEELTPQHLRS